MALRHPLRLLLVHLFHLIQARCAHALNLILPRVIQLLQLLVQLLLLVLQHCQQAVSKYLANRLLRPATCRHCGRGGRVDR